MSYITLQGLIDRIGEEELIQLTDATGTGTIDETKVARAIADADGEIDAYLAGTGILPLATVPPILERFAAVIVRYYLYTDAVPELIETHYSAAIKFLASVHDGKAQLGAADPGVSTPQTDAPSWSAPDAVFDAVGLEGY